MFHVQEFRHEIVELSQTLLGDGEISVFVVDYLINVGKSTPEIEVILWALGSLEGDIVELEISLIDGGRFEDQAVAVLVFLGNVKNLLRGEFLFLFYHSCFYYIIKKRFSLEVYINKRFLFSSYFFSFTDILTCLVKRLWDKLYLTVNYTVSLRGSVCLSRSIVEIRIEIV